MEAKQAKEILLNRGFSFEGNVLEGRTRSAVRQDHFTCSIDGYFSAIELEAIACWLRDPKAVSEAI